MIRSMTAYAGTESNIEGVDYSWEIRSVNHRYLDINLRIPEKLRSLETDFRAVLARQLKRGKIECTLTSQTQAANPQSISIDRQRMIRLLEVIREIEAELPNSQSCSALQIMQWPGVIIEKTADAEKLKDPIVALLQSAITRLVESREREGSQLSAMVIGRCRQMTDHIESVRRRLPEIVNKMRSKLRSKLEELPIEVDPIRFEQEIVIAIQKMDVDEEIERLEAQVIEIERVLENEHLVGRRLDFILQEMNRETNTLGSKSQDKEITRACVEMKVLIEQMREQVQNFE